jgi:hypothetical protein
MSRSLSYTAAFLFAALASEASAQRYLGTDCYSNSQGLLAQYGRAVAIAGDLDGDGRAEYIVGSPGANRLSGCYCDQVGAVFLPGAVSPVFGDDVDDRFGTAVAGRLDLDGDALPDAVGGAPGDDDLGLECGSFTALAANGAELYTVFGAAAGDELGSVLARIGDLDADGRDEFIVAAPQFTTGGAGYALVISGATGATLRTHVGAGPGALCGVGLTGIGDITADGVADYAVGSPGEALGGRVRVYSGSDGALVRTLDGAAAGDGFGHGLGAGTDLDRDGLDELIVGAPRGGLSSGAVWVYSGLTGAPLLQFDGREAGDWFGASVAGVGDFDGDGHGDVIVGVPYADPFAPFGFGSGAGAGTVFSGANGDVLARLGGGAPGARTGVSVAGGGDVDGDGVLDAVVGGLMTNDGYGDNACVVVLARTGTQRIDRGDASTMAYGHSVASGDDYDGDGARDVLLGAPEAADAQGLDTGMVRLVSSASGATLAEFFGEVDGDRLGQAVANAGDVNGDGVDDLLVGSAQDRYPDHWAQGTQDGYAKVHCGATGVELHRFEIPGDTAFGRALAGGGDVDGDGFDDVIVGGALVDLDAGRFESAGHVRVYSGATGAELHAFDGVDSYDGLGFSVALIEDLTGDGKDEFLFGVPGRIGYQPSFFVGEVELRSGGDGALLHSFQSWDLHNGTALTRLADVSGDGVEDIAFSAWDVQSIWSWGSVQVHSGADFSLLWNQASQVAYTGPSFGYALASAGDVDGDTFDDLAIGNPGTNDWHATSIGAVQVRSGADGQLLSSYSGYSGWDYFGYSLAGIGDVNGDGQPDLAVGAPTDPENAFGAEASWNRVHFVLSNYLRQYSYCTPSANASGGAATLSATGLGSVAENDLTLSVTGAPATVNGVFFMGANVHSTPFHGGTKCVKGSLRRLSATTPTTGAGTAALSVDLSSAPADVIQPGSTWGFQFLFRDPNGPSGSPLNLSDAVRIEFLP